MISMVMPYWNRNAATNRSMWLLNKHYEHIDMEIIVVDDGSKEEFIPEGHWPKVRIIKLPRKDVAMCGCTPINVGVMNAIGDVIVLTNPEMLHNQPVLEQMLAELDATGPMGYIAAAAWYEREKQWHAHSSLIRDGQRDNYKQPINSAFHFCTMLYRTLWDKAGGFDEEYREGSHWDDPDWVNRLARAGAIFKMRDDLVVEHTRDGAETCWPGGGTDRNKALFMRKWPG